MSLCVNKVEFTKRLKQEKKQRKIIKMFRLRNDLFFPFNSHNLRSRMIFFRMSFQKVKRISIRSAFFDSTKLWKVFHNMFDKRVNISFFTSRYLYIEDWNNWIRAKKEKKFKSLNQTRVGRSCSLLISSECLISYLESLLLVLWVFLLETAKLEITFPISGGIERCLKSASERTSEGMI